MSRPRRVGSSGTTARRTGRAERDEHVQGVESVEIDVKLRESDRTREAVLEDIRSRLSLLPGVNVTIGQPISHRIDHMLSGTRANLAIKIFGEDLHALRDLGAEVQSAVQGVEGLVDLSVEQQTDIPTVRVTGSSNSCSSLSRGRVKVLGCGLA
ncbi:MAG: efflux RND transporter permease subunit [Acidobacteriota bacterium]